MNDVKSLPTNLVDLRTLVDNLDPGVQHSDTVLMEYLSHSGHLTIADVLDSNDLNEVKHHGVKGMKWGVRKDERSRRGPDGDEDKVQKRARKAKERLERKRARQRARDEKKRVTTSTKPSTKTSQLTDDQLLAAIERMSIEYRYNQLLTSLTPKPKQSVLNRIMKEAGQDILKRAATDIGTAYVKKAFNVVLDERLPEKFRVGKLPEPKKK